MKCIKENKCIYVMSQISKFGRKMNHDVYVLEGSKEVGKGKHANCNRMKAKNGMPEV